ncbi:hypothetical protein OUZ56_017080 [Daphnia magna]|uniref:Uncharacterized protein n=1 Tax=Daphnia magna TaxID=35525 RepID=A0ABR0ASA3_9CRUS|nr:hypothetical protein OUZ56_017080 [Daphnia magna]
MLEHAPEVQQKYLVQHEEIVVRFHKISIDWKKKKPVETTSMASPILQVAAPSGSNTPPSTTVTPPMNAMQLQVPEYYAMEKAEYYTTTYAEPAYYTEAPQYYTTKAPEYYAPGMLPILITPRRILLPNAITTSPHSTRRRMDVPARAQCPEPEWDVVATS